MVGIANWLLAYATAHLLATLVVVPVACLVLRMRAIAPGMRAALLLMASVLVVAGPAISLQVDSAGQAITTISNASAIAETPAADVGVAPEEPSTGAKHGGIMIAPGLAALVLAAWLAGAAWALARLLVAHSGLCRILVGSGRSPALEAACGQVLPAGVQILVSPAFGPAAVGILRPKIILPHGMVRALPADALRAVLLHEATHHRRRDLHALLVQRLVEALFWWNPLVRLLGKASDAIREVACDIDAARAYGASTDYAEALLDSIAHFVPPLARADAHALHAGASLSTLDRRIDAIIEAPRSPGWTGKALVTGVGGALMLLCIGASIAAPDIALKQTVDQSEPAAMHKADALPSGADSDALLALHDRSQSMRENQDRYSQAQALQLLTDSYTRDEAALAEPPPHEIAVERPVDQASPVAVRNPHAVPSDEDALLALHHRYSQSMYENQDRYSQALYLLTESYTREATALAEQPPHDGKDARLQRLNEHYDRLRSSTERRFRDAATQAEAEFLAARSALATRSDTARMQ